MINRKISGCVAGIWVFKMASEGHFEKTQNFLREQVYNGKYLDNNSNIVKFSAKIFGIYSKFVSEHNVNFGEKIFDFLIEII